jgi:DHA3 family macrolide efflux protein-like MFS transporter
MQALVSIWAGQLVSLVASGVSVFSLNLWILQQSGSIWRFALAFFLTSLPGLLLAPFAGVFVDRHDLRRTMLKCDVAAGIITASMLALSFTAAFSSIAIYAAMVLQSCLAAFRWPAYQALISSLSPPENLPRMAGMVQLAEACNYILAPVLGGLLFPVYGLHLVLAIDVAGSSIAFATLWHARGDGRRTASSSKSFFGDIECAWRYLRNQPALLRLLAFFAGMNLVAAMVMVLVTPYLLSFAPPRVLGQVMSSAALGMLAGGLVMIATKPGVRLVRGIARFSVVGGVAIGMAGLQRAPWWFALCGFVFFFSMAVVNAKSQALWQLRVDASVQGRVFSARRALAMLTLPLGQLLSGPLGEKAERVMSREGALAPTFIGSLLGVGPGHGIALIFLGIGLYSVLLAGLCLRGESFAALERAGRTPEQISALHAH